MRNRIAFCFYSASARALRAARDGIIRTSLFVVSLVDRCQVAATRKTANINLAIINERR